MRRKLAVVAMSSSVSNMCYVRNIQLAIFQLNIKLDAMIESRRALLSRLEENYVYCISQSPKRRLQREKVQGYWRAVREYDVELCIPRNSRSGAIRVLDNSSRFADKEITSLFTYADYECANVISSSDDKEAIYNTTVYEAVQIFTLEDVTRICAEAVPDVIYCFSDRCVPSGYKSTHCLTLCGQFSPEFKVAGWERMYLDNFIEFARYHQQNQVYFLRKT